MIAAKQIITGSVVRIDGNMIYVRRGDGTLDSYNSKYYRIVED